MVAAAAWRAAWNLQVSGVYFRNADIRFGTAPSGAQEQFTAPEQGAARVEYKPGKFTFVGGSVYLTGGERAPFGGAGVDAGVVVSPRLELLSRIDVIRVSGGALAVASPAAILRHRPWRQGWGRIQYIHQRGVDVPDRTHVGLFELGFEPHPRLVASTTVVRTHPRDADAHSALLGSLRYRLSRDSRAMLTFRRSTETSPAGHLVLLGFGLGAL